MAVDTKNRILDAALDMMADKGYDATNIRELSQALGLSKAAMYRHFTGKEDLFRALIERTQDYYRAHMDAFREQPMPATAGELMEMTLRMVDFTVHDTRIIKVRRLLLTEQFHSETVRNLATRYFLTGMEEQFTPVFAAMTQSGVLKKADPAMLAFAYTSPITALIHLCDREPEKEREILSRVSDWITFFIESYQA